MCVHITLIIIINNAIIIIFVIRKAKLVSQIFLILALLRVLSFSLLDQFFILFLVGLEQIFYLFVDQLLFFRFLLLQRSPTLKER